MDVWEPHWFTIYLEQKKVSRNKQLKAEWLLLSRENTSMKSGNVGTECNHFKMSCVYGQRFFEEYLSTYSYIIYNININEPCPISACEQLIAHARRGSLGDECLCCSPTLDA